MTFNHWLILAVLGAAFGASFAFNEVLLVQYGPLTVSAVRVALGAVGCWLWLRASGCASHIPLRAMPGIALLGIFQYAAPFAFLPVAQQHITSSAAGVANAMTPLAVVVVSQFWPGGERITAAKIAGVSLGILGIAALTVTTSDGVGSDPRFVIVAVMAPVCYGIALNLTRHVLCDDPLVLTTWAMTLGALAILPFALGLDGLPPLPTATSFSAFAVLGFGLTTVTFVALYMILPKVGATNLSLVTFIAPISATAIGYFALSEEIGLQQLLGAALILAGLAVIDGRLPRLVWRRVRRRTA